jgi:hypothetical protein
MIKIARITQSIKAGVFMFNSRLIFLSALVTCSSFASTNIEQKLQRVESLMKLHSVAPAMAFEAYHRELEYEKSGLSIDARAKKEANLLADKIRSQVHMAYQAALDKHESPQEARDEVRNAIEKDLDLADVNMKDDLLKLANDTLDEIESGGFSQEVHLENLEQVLKEEVLKRELFLNEDLIISDAKISNPEPIDDAEKKEFNSKAELIDSLVSERASTRWVSTSNQTLKTAQITSLESKVSVQLKVSFLGATVEAGPIINFKKVFTTNAMVMSEGMSTVILRDGNFDYWKRDQNGKVVVKNGKDQKRYISFSCDANLNFETDYQGSGGFSFMGLGAGGSVSKKYSNSVNIASRRITLPEFVAGKSVTVKYISEVCHNDFLKARFNNSLTVMGSLEVMMKNVISGLTFSHPKTKCAADEHCYNWFNKEVISLVKINNFPRCREGSSIEKFRTCQLSGLEGQNCPVYENGKRTSDGQWEYNCDAGLKCVKYENQTFFLGSVWSYAKGKCQVIDRKSYRSPFKK